MNYHMTDSSLNMNRFIMTVQDSGMALAVKGVDKLIADSAAPKRRPTPKAKRLTSAIRPSP
jgi:hypothetical protein